MYSQNIYFFLSIVYYTAAKSRQNFNVEWAQKRLICRSEITIWENVMHDTRKL